MVIFAFGLLVILIFTLVDFARYVKKNKELEAENQKLRRNIGKLKKDYCYESMRYRSCLRTVADMSKELNLDSIGLRKRLNDVRAVWEDRDLKAITDLIDKEYQEA